MGTRPKILVITPVSHIKGVKDILQSAGDVTYMEDPSQEEVISVISDFQALYTNPNKTKVFLGSEVLSQGKSLKVIGTASTGTNHIDLQYVQSRNIKVLSLTEEREVINRISSTAELAFALMMTSLRNIVPGYKSVIDGGWDYMSFIGRQLDKMSIGVIGYGRLGGFFSGYCQAFGAQVLAYDPYKKIDSHKVEQTDDIEMLISRSDVVSLHVHVNNETIGLINKARLDNAKNDLLLVNTSRGEIVNEMDLVCFLRANPEAKVATDVLCDEVKNRDKSPLLSYAKKSDQVIVTPHIGGMTREAQEIAYSHAARLLNTHLKGGS